MPHPVAKKDEPSRDTLLPDSGIDGGDNRSAVLSMHLGGALRQHQDSTISCSRELLKG